MNAFQSHCFESDSKEFKSLVKGIQEFNSIESYFANDLCPLVQVNNIAINN